jgi:hypothetical protein
MPEPTHLEPKQLQRRAVRGHPTDVISGTRVVDPELALRCVSEGATFRQIRGVRLLTMERQQEFREVSDE